MPNEAEKLTPGVIISRAENRGLRVSNEAWLNLSTGCACAAGIGLAIRNPQLWKSGIGIRELPILNKYLEDPEGRGLRDGFKGDVQSVTMLSKKDETYAFYHAVGAEVRRLTDVSASPS